MDDKEKMLSGQLHNPSVEILKKDRMACKSLCYEFNNLHPSKTTERKDLIKTILGNVKGRAWIEQPFMCDYGYNIEVGDGFYANHNLIILDSAKVEFGDNVLIGPNCSFYTPEHPLDVQTRNEGLEYANPIKVGNNVWFGGNVVVLSGVTIGDNVVIGAGSVVTKDIPSGVLAVGNPCKVVRTL